MKGREMLERNGIFWTRKTIGGLGSLIITQNYILVCV